MCTFRLCSILDGMVYSNLHVNRAPGVHLVYLSDFVCRESYLYKWKNTATILTISMSLKWGPFNTNVTIVISL